VVLVFRLDKQIKPGTFSLFTDWNSSALQKPEPLPEDELRSPRILAAKAVAHAAIHTARHVVSTRG
jgi:hypothetical protein